jgi:sulfite reductase (NADPH) hemoprotein beta-component
VAAQFKPPVIERKPRDAADRRVHEIIRADAEADPLYDRWLQRNVLPHRDPQLRAVILSFKRLGQAPGDATADQLDAAADLAERFSAGEARVTHEQNLLLPWVHQDDLPELWAAARKLGLARPNIGLVTDMIACPGGDFCSLANARSLPIAEAITTRFQDLDEEWDIGEIDINFSGCINSCGHHHAGHIGILGVDKDGKEWYQITLGGSDGSDLSGPATPGKIIGPSFAKEEVAGVIEALIDTYRRLRQPAADGRYETFIATFRRVGIEPFKAAANGARFIEKEVA